MSFFLRPVALVAKVEPVRLVVVRAVESGLGDPAFVGVANSTGVVRCVAGVDDGCDDEVDDDVEVEL